MNKIYALRYSTAAGGLIAVSEFAKKCACRLTGKKHLNAVVMLSSMCSSGLAGASIVSAEIDYQIFRDFAENKGVFQPGTTDIAIDNRQGDLVGLLDKAAMPNFSSANARLAVATLIAPQYVASVKHNGGYKSVSFGDGENRYNIVDRNNHASQDFHTPRLDKLVTEVAPASVTEEGQKINAYINTSRYIAFYRLGSGTQYIKGRNGQVTQLSGAYSYLTGGTVGAPVSSNHIVASNPGNIFNPVNGPLSSYGASGDSGSPLFAYDSWQQKWVMVGVLSTWTGQSGVNNRWAVIPLDFVEQTFADDNDAPVNVDASKGGMLAWSFDQSTGTGSLIQADTTYAMHGQLGSDLNTGKNLIFSGKGGQIDLKNNVVQGAGVLTFKDDYTVTSSTGSIWTGGGVIVDKDVSVNWQVNGMRGDRLHKIGEGTLIVNGAGVNEGSLKVGDGITLLNQQMDGSGGVQAFDSVNIASGRPTLVLSDSRQVNPDNIFWGYHGGTLDVNGNSLTFHKLNAADYGAVLANHAKSRATITLDYAQSPENVALKNWSASRKGTIGDLYEYRNQYTKTTDYFILKKNSYGYLPTKQNSNDVWEYVGHKRIDAQKLVAERRNAKGYLYHGQFSGDLNVSNIAPPGTTGALVLDGSADITGTFTQENGRLVLQGHPVIHAYNTKALADKLVATGDTSVRTQPTSFEQHDWENRHFTFDTLILKNTDFGLGRNASLDAIIDAKNSVITLGDSRVFIDKKDGNGVDFSLEEGRSEATDEADKSVFNGSAVLTGNTQLNIENALFIGGIIGHSGTNVQLSPRGTWNLTKSSTLDTFRSEGGSISFITHDWSPKTLTVNTMDANNLHIDIGTNVIDGTSDRIDILHRATGGNNILDPSPLFDQTVVLKNDLTLASAPVGTPHDYFFFAGLNRGFTMYTPDTQIQEKGGRVLWQMKYNSVQGTNNDITMPSVEDNNDPSHVHVMAAFAVEGNFTADESHFTADESYFAADENATDENNAADGQIAALSLDNPETVVEGRALYKAADNTALLNKARNMFASREYILSDNADRWQQVVDDSGTGSGMWATGDYSHGGYDVFELNQSGLDMGLRKTGDHGAWWGVGIEMSRGYSKADGYRDDFTLWGGSLLAGKNFASGLFVDGMVGYRQLSEDFSIQGELSDLSGKVKSHIGTAGVRSGWRVSLDSIKMTITPSVSLNTALIDSKLLQGNDRSVELNSGSAIWLKAGVQAEKAFERLSVNAGIWRHFTLNDMPGVTLSDTSKARYYAAEKANRYTFSVGIDGKVTDRLGVLVKLNSSADGYFKTDYEGVLGLRYNF